LTRALVNKVNITCFPSLTEALDTDRIGHLLKIADGLLTGKFDIVHFNIIPHWLHPIWAFLRVTKAWKTKTVLNVHGFIPLELMFDRIDQTNKLISDNLLLQLSRRIYQSVDRIVVNSHYMFNKIVDYYGIESSKIVIIPNGVDLKRFSDQEKSMMLDGAPSILYLGGLFRRKGVDILIKAVAKAKAKLPGIRLHLVGSGSFGEYLEELAINEKIDKQVIFWGHADYAVIPEYYKSADICVFPSRYEPFGIVVLEAFASGKPVVASCVGGISETVSDGKNGILVKPNDPRALSNAIVKLSEDGVLRKNISKCASETAARYSWENIAGEYLRLYSNLVRDS
jgi:glycosyltransferase involved in cell wall biosynthesis